MPPVEAPHAAAASLDDAVTTAPPAANSTSEPSYVTRDAWLALAGKLREEEHAIEGLGKVILSELTGAVRAQIQSSQSRGLLSDVKSIDVVGYQRTILQAGIMDPASPAEARRPLFSMGDMDAVMRIGGAKLEVVLDHLERLSGLGKYQGSAEGNSGSSPSSDGTS